MTVRVFRQSDASAPVLSAGSVGVAGEVTTLLDAVLVTGYPTQGIESITRSGSTATVTLTTHGYTTGNIISISGADEDEYNGNHQITVTGADTFTYTVTGTPATPAVSSLMLASNGKTSLGWRLVYGQGTNKRVYQIRGGNQHFLRVDHNSWPDTAGFRGYETMSDVDTGIGPFPTVAQQANGLKQVVATGGSGEKSWFIVGDEFGFHMMVEASGQNTSQCTTFSFGELLRFLPSDPYSTCIIGGINPQTKTTNGQILGTVVTGLAAATVGCYVARSYTGILQAVQAAIIKEQTRSTSTNSGSGTPSSNVLTYPAPIDGGLHLERMMIAEIDQGLRGLLRGVWFLAHERTQLAAFGLEWSSAGHGTQFDGSSGIAGKTFELQIVTYSGTFGMIVWEISDTWDPIV